ncbi:MAG TPA: two-component regulator propeller domain-containing protein, partial [Niastella sp.]|nr:two-component regulator propeller domain-containing protein [Niastella sp.]
PNSKMVRTQAAVTGSVGCGVQDKNGNLWFGTGGEGLYLYDGTSFTQFTTKNGLCDNKINAMVIDHHGDLLLATGNGVCRFDPLTRKSINLTGHDERMRKTCSILEDSEGNIWFGSQHDGLWLMKDSAGQTLFTNFLHTYDHPYSTGNAHQLINHISQDKKGNIWFCSWNGGGVWKYGGKTFVNYIPPPSYYLSHKDGRSPINPQQNVLSDLVPQINTADTHNDSLTDDMIFSATEDSAGNIWFATRRHGACKYDARLNDSVGQGKSFTSYGEKNGFADYGIYVMLEDKKGNMWFGTERNGVFCYDGKTFKNFTTSNGLVNNSVFSITEDLEGHLWFGTRNFGLCRYDGKT